MEQKKLAEIHADNGSENFKLCVNCVKILMSLVINNISKVCISQIDCPTTVYT